MKNRVTDYLTKVSNNQIKSVVDRKKFIETDTLCECAMNELKKIYWYEKELLLTIPLLMSNAQTFELVDTLTLLIQYTREHIMVLETQFPDIAQLPLERKKYNSVA